MSSETIYKVATWAVIFSTKMLWNNIQSNTVKFLGSWQLFHCLWRGRGVQLERTYVGNNILVVWEGFLGACFQWTYAISLFYCGAAFSCWFSYPVFVAVTVCHLLLILASSQGRRRTLYLYFALHFSSYKAWFNMILDRVHTLCFRHVVTSSPAFELFLECRQAQEQELVFAVFQKEMFCLLFWRRVERSMKAAHFFPLWTLFLVPCYLGELEGMMRSGHWPKKKPGRKNGI